MLELVNARLSISMRLALIGALFLAPIVFLVYLFVAQSLSDIEFAQREIAGTRYLAAVWPTFARTAASGAVANGDIAERASYDALFGTADASAAFADAKDVAGKLEAGKTFIGAVADKSNLTLDPDLDSFYAMDAATVRIPGIEAAAVALAQAVAEPTGPSRIVDIAFAVDHLRISSDDAAGSLDSAMKNNGAGVTSKALAAPAAALKAASDAMLEQGKAVLEGREAKAITEAETALLESGRRDLGADERRGRKAASGAHRRLRLAHGPQPRLCRSVPGGGDAAVACRSRAACPDGCNNCLA